MLGFANAVEISGRPPISPLKPGDFPTAKPPGTILNTDEHDDGFDEHVVSMSEGGARSHTLPRVTRVDAPDLEDLPCFTALLRLTRAPRAHARTLRTQYVLMLPPVPADVPGILHPMKTSDIYSMAILARVFASDNLHFVWIAFLALLCAAIQVLLHARIGTRHRIIPAHLVGGASLFSCVHINCSSVSRYRHRC